MPISLSMNTELKLIWKKKHCQLEDMKIGVTVLKDERERNKMNIKQCYNIDGNL